EEVRAFARLLAGIELRHRLHPGTIRILAIIETALGVVNLKDIAASDTRLDALLFGAEDLCGDMGAVRTRQGREVAYPRSAVAIRRAAPRMEAIATPLAALQDGEGLATETREALPWGYSGKRAIHPRQVEPIQAIFTPEPEEVARARRLIEEHERQQST